MGKWLAAGGVALLVVLLLLWRQLETGSATAATPAPRAAAGEAPVRAMPAPAGSAAPSVPTAGSATAELVPGPLPNKREKMEVESDEFFYKFQEVVPAVLSRKAAECYEGVSKRVHRNQKLVLHFKVKIKDGEVTINDVKAGENTIGNPALETCFTQAVQRGGWHDDSLPDWEADDELVIRPERGLKKYMRDNLDYVGAPAPRD